MSHCVSSIWKSTNDYYSNLAHRNVSAKKPFWECMKALFSGKNSASNKVTIIENDFLDKNVLDNIVKIVGVFNTYLLK